MVRAALWFELRLGLQTQDIGRAGDAPEHSCTLQTSGANLFYVITLDGGFVSLTVEPMDSGESEKLMTTSDCAKGWLTVARLVEALENSGVQKLQPRPIRTRRSLGDR